jgi:hypothetical protein
LGVAFYIIHIHLLEDVLDFLLSAPLLDFKPSSAYADDIREWL